MYKNSTSPKAFDRSQSEQVYAIVNKIWQPLPQIEDRLRIIISVLPNDPSGLYSLTDVSLKYKDFFGTALTADIAEGLPYFGPKNSLARAYLCKSKYFEVVGLGANTSIRDLKPLYNELNHLREQETTLNAQLDTIREKIKSLTEDLIQFCQ